MGVALLTAGFIAFGGVMFALVSQSSQPLLAFPVLVSLWIWYLCVVVPRAVVMLSVPPHRPGRVTLITIGISLVAVAALIASIYVGLTIFSVRAGMP